MYIMYMYVCPSLLSRAHGMCSNLPLGEGYCISLPRSNPGQSNVAVSPCCKLRAATPPLRGGCRISRAATPPLGGGYWCSNPAP